MASSLRERTYQASVFTLVSSAGKFTLQELAKSIDTPCSSCSCVPELQTTRSNMSHVDSRRHLSVSDDIKMGVDGCFGALIIRIEFWGYVKV